VLRMRRYKLRVALITLLLSAAVTAGATVLHVPDDHSTIQAGIDAAAENDTVMVADGTYILNGNYDIDFDGVNLVLMSESGNPDDCIIDCQGTASDRRRGFYFHHDETADSRVVGFTVTGGFATMGGAVNCDNASPTFDNCVFAMNTGDNYGGAVALFQSRPRFINCRFLANGTHEPGMVFGGAVYATDSPATFDTCLFALNHAVDGYGGAVYFEGYPPPPLTRLDEPVFNHCTFVQNTASYGAAIAVYDTEMLFNNSLLAFNGPGGAVWCDENGRVSLFCCDVFGHNLGDYIGCLLGQAGQNGNFSADPMFCDSDVVNYEIHMDSPCARYNNSCGVRIGSERIGCGYTCGDVNSDGTINIIDIINLINYVYKDGPEPYPWKAGDINGDGEINILDIIPIILYKYKGGAPPSC